MTATLTFNLPEEAQEYRDALNGTAYRAVLQEVDDQLRNWLKHGHEFGGAVDAMDTIRTRITEELEGRNLTIHD